MCRALNANQPKSVGTKPSKHRIRMVDLFETVILPIADKKAAEQTCEAVRPYVTANESTVVAVHVIEKAGGAPVKASVEQRELEAEGIFDRVETFLEDEAIDCLSRIAYGTDVVETVLQIVEEEVGTVIMFTPRSANRWVKLLTGDVAYRLIHRSETPVLVIPPTGE